MALTNNDKIVVQRQTGNKDHFSANMNALYDYIAAHPTLVYRGLIDLTQVPTGQINPDPSLLGDVYLNSNAGTLAPGYTGLAVGTVVELDDRLIFNGTEYDIIHSNGLVGVETVSGAAPIVVDNNDPANPIVSLLEIDGGVYAT